MEDLDQIEAVAKLDGWWKLNGPEPWIHPDISGLFECAPDYLNSYDAIIMVIQKQDWKVSNEVECWILGEVNDFFKATPRQLCEALLRTTGKWIE